LQFNCVEVFYGCLSPPLQIANFPSLDQTIENQLQENFQSLIPREAAVLIIVITDSLKDFSWHNIMIWPELRRHDSLVKFLKTSALMMHCS
jgi:hypothetical protein